MSPKISSRMLSKSEPNEIPALDSALPNEEENKQIVIKEIVHEVKDIVTNAGTYTV